ncbi:MAG TPA: VC_2705 family sodium/solute symporter [Kouleothrix sp.]|nr:VC_2705 family sodium/solute symporter [Kouleothrix sp.]
MQTITAFNWFGLVQLIVLWLLVVLVAVWVLDWLFPPLRRDESELPAPRQPTQPRFARLVSNPGVEHPKAPALPTRQLGYAAWRSNLRIIGVMLFIWVGVSAVPALFSPQLNQFQILTGFPLGYYMGAQGSLVVFLGLITGYAWWAARHDRQIASTLRLPDGTREGRAATRRLGVIYILFTVGFILFALIIGALEQRFDLPANISGWALMIIMIMMYAVIGVANRTSNLDEYFVAGRRIPAFFNGMAIGADWMSAASFISLAGTLWLLGYEGLAYIMGWTGGYVLLALLLAPYLRKFGQYTIPDFVATRYEGHRPRVVAAVIGVIISFTYLTAQVTGIGIIMSRFLGVNYLAGVAIGLSAVLFCSYLGGMRAITWTQVAQCIVLLIAYLTPVTLLSARSTGVPIPQIMYGEALQQITRLEAAQGITSSYVTPFNNWTPWNFLALMFCLMAGTAGLPHILIRFYTVPNVGAARRSVGWALLFICLLYFTAPAYAAFSRLEVMQNVVGKPITAVPEWAVNWANVGLIEYTDLTTLEHLPITGLPAWADTLVQSGELTITDRNRDGLVEINELGGTATTPHNGVNPTDGILQFDELKIDPDVVVLATPEIAGLPHTVAALVAAGGLAAALSTADGLLLVIASALSHDLYTRTLNPGSAARERLLLGRAMVFLVAVAAAFAATRRLPLIVQLVAWAFSFAAATFFPILVLGIFWKRANGRGAMAGMIAGLLVTLAYMLLNAQNPSFSVLGITNVAAGIFGMPVNFLVTIVVSKLTPPPSPTTQAMVESLR